jgi:hypothetical protein
MRCLIASHGLPGKSKYCRPLRPELLAPSRFCIFKILSSPVDSKLGGIEKEESHVGEEARQLCLPVVHVTRIVLKCSEIAARDVGCGAIAGSLCPQS